MTSETLTVALAAAGAAALLVVLATVLLAWEASHRDLARRVQRVVHSDEIGQIAPARRLGGVIAGVLARFGEAIRDAAIFSARNIEDLERTAAMADRGGSVSRYSVSAPIGGFPAG